MFKNETTKGELDGFLDRGSRVEGELHFQDTFRVNGTVVGKIASEGNLVVGEGGVVEGEVRVARVHVAGTVRGTIQGAERVEIAGSGRVEGEIETGALVVEDGAVLEGHCRMNGEPATKAATAVLPGMASVID